MLSPCKHCPSCTPFSAHAFFCAHSHAVPCSRRHKLWHTQGHWFRLTYAASPTIVQKISNSLRTDEAVIRTVCAPLLPAASRALHSCRVSRVLTVFSCVSLPHTMHTNSHSTRKIMLIFVRAGVKSSATLPSQTSAAERTSCLQPPPVDPLSLACSPTPVSMMRYIPQHCFDET